MIILPVSLKKKEKNNMTDFPLCSTKWLVGCMKKQIVQLVFKNNIGV